MKKTIFSFYFIFLSVFTQEIFAQRSNLIYAEFGGSAGLYSLNYDVRFSKKNHGLGLRVGLSAVGKNAYSIISPMQINYVVGKKNHALELGAGFLVIAQPTASSHKLFSFPAAVVMYRYQPSDIPLSFRVGWTPIFIPQSNGQYDFGIIGRFLPGISVGYRF